jgi:hypothetical protein
VADKEKQKFIITGTGIFFRKIKKNGRNVNTKGEEGEGEIISKKDEDYEEVLLGKRSEN